ncbi:MAG: enoyl-CoA hydratase/isomerase family protein [Acidimicrobiia bacterium]|nr:enoyl-CoA hydratase/isomerase family protein [Acidimicrobiia bacterium]
MSLSEQPWERLKVRETDRRVDITISWPERRNALDFTTWDELDRVMLEVARHDEVRVVTLTGEDPAFCAGVSFDAIGSSLGVEKQQYPSFIRRWAGVADHFERVAQPTIAAINGPAIGAGFEIALACDLRIASDRAVFCMPQMRMGIVPDAGGTSRLARAAGSAVAKDLVLSSRVIDAEEALRCGIVSRVVPHEELGAEVDALADQVAELPWPSAYFAVVAIDSGPHLDPRRAADLEGIADQVMLRQDEVWEKVEGFMASRGLKGFRP